MELDEYFTDRVTMPIQWIFDQQNPEREDDDSHLSEKYPLRRRPKEPTASVAW